MVKISIVMPVYNTGEYLLECINDIRKQTFEEYEVICVDDCSDDGSYEVLKNIAEKDKRFKILHNNVRKGAGISRNIGFVQATANYIVFLDADDRYEKEMLEEMYHAIVDYDADIAFIEFDRFDTEKGVGDKKNISPRDTDRFREHTFELRDVSIEKMLKMGCQPWTRIVKRQFIEEKGIRYQDLESSNDVYFGFMSMMLAQRMIFVKSYEKLLHHRINSKNQISALRNPYCAYESMYALEQGMKSYLIWEKYYEYFYAIFLGTIRGEFTKCRNEKTRYEFNKFLESQGFQNIGLESDPCYEKLDQGYKLSFAIMKIQNYYSKWWEKADEMKYLLTLSSKADKMKKLWELATKNSYKICAIGKEFFVNAMKQFFEVHNWEVEIMKMEDVGKTSWVETNMVDKEKIYVVINQKDYKYILNMDNGISKHRLVSLSQYFVTSDSLKIE